MTQPKTGSKFTPGALRAAKFIAAEVIRLHDTVIVKGELNETARQGWIVEIIDRETKAPEMYELLVYILDENRARHSGMSALDTLVSLGSQARRIKAAIDGEG